MGKETDVQLWSSVEMSTLNAQAIGLRCGRMDPPSPTGLAIFTSPCRLLLYNQHVCELPFALNGGHLQRRTSRSRLLREQLLILPLQVHYIPATGQVQNHRGNPARAPPVLPWFLVNTSTLETVLDVADLRPPQRVQEVQEKRYLSSWEYVTVQVVSTNPFRRKKLHPISYTAKTISTRPSYCAIISHEVLKSAGALPDKQ